MTTLNVRIDEKLKKQASELFADLGLDMSTAIIMFLKQSVMRDGIPFEIIRPNAETLAAMAEVEEMKAHPEKYRGYTDVDKMFEELLK